MVKCIGILAVHRWNRGVVFDLQCATSAARALLAVLSLSPCF
jgi:hypothetical protein